LHENLGVARLFIAVWMPRTIVELLRTVPRPELTGVRWLPEEHFHVTLRFVGDAEATEARAALDGVTLPAAHARLGPATRRLGGSLIVVPVAGLDTLAGAVTAATAHLGAPTDRRRFTGHVTLARIRRGTEASIEPSAVEASFAVEEVTLVSSHLSPSGAVYHPVARWPTTRYPR
jgi:2'-5' RNA ligase